MHIGLCLPFLNANIYGLINYSKLSFSSNSTVCVCGFQSNKIADTCAEQARKGKDIQGIPWDRLSITRDKYRQTRLQQYKNYENVPHSGDSSAKVSPPSIHPSIHSLTPFSYSPLVSIIIICLITSSGLHGHTERGYLL